MQRQDPTRRIVRQQGKARRLPTGARCIDCGESDPLTLVRGSAPIRCMNCHADGRGKSRTERHHPSGRNNDPKLTVAISRNDHAVLSDAQQDWPERTLTNPDGSPLLKAAAAIRAWVDTLRLIMERAVGWIPEWLEALEEWLCQQVGDRWWEHFEHWRSDEEESR